MPTISPSTKGAETEGTAAPKRKTKCRNAYQREMQRIYRKAEADERKRLQDTVATLEAALVTERLARSLLPWRDVADALGNASKASIEKNVTMRRRVMHAAVLARAMHDYVSRLLATSATLHGRIETWQHVSLLSSQAARSLGFDWITRQLYHNTNAVLAANDFPVTTDTFFDINVSEDSTTVVIRHMRTVPWPVDVVTQGYHTFFIGGNGFGYALEELDSDLHLLEHDMVYRRRNVGNRVLGNMQQNYVHRQFREPHRSVLVARNILSDEHHPLGMYKRDASGWVVATAAGPHHTLVQEVWTVCPLLKGSENEPAPLVDEGYLYGLDLTTVPPHLQFPTLQQAVFRTGQSVLAKRAQFFETLKS
ncbi:hypothetical protein ACHHYP_17351 [Achlya hypogyna]|uniref:Uncharacterized protein n=1 Tax=Achlya hypogyna TaxID=1202772 RepID=A0A1V9Y4M2_ACHHY|nr:hypothetical protein ACHHYP_17351 [Achlya hypogyna]